MVAHEGASLVRLTVDIHGIEGFVQSLVKWPILSVELLAHCHLKFMDPCLLNIINELDLHALRKSEDILLSPGFFGTTLTSALNPKAAQEKQMVVV